MSLLSDRSPFLSLGFEGANCRDTDTRPVSAHDSQVLDSIPEGGGILEQVGLYRLMQQTEGRREIVIGLIDGPVESGHPDLTAANIRTLESNDPSVCNNSGSPACLHGTFIAGMLSARRGSAAPALCPGCTLLVRPIFLESTTGPGPMPSATPAELAQAIFDCIEAGAHIVNLSVALSGPFTKGAMLLLEALDYALRRQILVVAAAGNYGTVGSSSLVGHPGVIPVVACDRHGMVASFSNLGNTIGKRGLCAPGEQVTSLRAGSTQPLTWGGTSVAAPFVTAMAALLWSVFPAVRAFQVRHAMTQGSRSRHSIVPPLMDIWRAYAALQELGARRK